MKKILTLTLAALSLGLAPNAMADWDVFNRIEVHAAGTYTKPSNNGLEVGSQAIEGPIANFLLGRDFLAAQRLLHLEPGFRWNFALGGSYAFCGTNTKFFVDYEFFQDHDYLAGGPFVQGLLPFIAGRGAAEEVAGGSLFSRVEMKQNMFRFGFEQEIPFCDQFWLRPAVYFEFDRLIQKQYERFDIPDTDNRFQSDYGTAYLNVLNKLHGWGPGFGLKALWAPWCNCPDWKFFGGIMGTILFARQEGDLKHELPPLSGGISFDVLSISAAAESSPTNHTVIIDPTNIALVSKFDIDVGFDFTRKFCVDNARMLMGFTIGIRYQNMINAIKYSNRYVINFYQPSTNYNPVDWGRAGPYIQFRIGGADSK